MCRLERTYGLTVQNQIQQDVRVCLQESNSQRAPLLTGGDYGTTVRLVLVKGFDERMLATTTSLNGNGFIRFRFGPTFP